MTRTDSLAHSLSLFLLSARYTADGDGSTTNMKYESVDGVDACVVLFHRRRRSIIITSRIFSGLKPFFSSFFSVRFDFDWSLAMWRLSCQNTIFHFFSFSQFRRRSKRARTRFYMWSELIASLGVAVFCFGSMELGPSGRHTFRM